MKKKPSLRGSFVVACVVSLTLASCATHGIRPSQQRYQVYTPSPDSNVKLQFEYPIGWQAKEENYDDFTSLILCEPWPEEVATPPGPMRGGRRCSDVIDIAAYLVNAYTPDLETAITWSLKHAQTTPDYVLVHRSITLSDHVADRVELCFSPAGYDIPDPFPQVRHEVYFQVGQRIYEINASSGFVGRPCDPSTVKFPEFEHLLKTLVILEQ